MQIMVVLIVPDGTDPKLVANWLYNQTGATHEVTNPYDDSQVVGEFTITEIGVVHRG